MGALTLGLIIALGGQVVFRGGTFTSTIFPSGVPSANLTAPESEVCGELENYDSTASEAVGNGFNCYQKAIGPTENADGS